MKFTFQGPQNKHFPQGGPLIPLVERGTWVIFLSTPAPNLQAPFHPSLLSYFHTRHRLHVLHGQLCTDFDVPFVWKVGDQEAK